MVNHSIRPSGWFSIAFTISIILSMAGKAQAGETDCEATRSPITRSSYQELVWKAIAAGASEEDLINIAGRAGPCRNYIAYLINLNFNKEP